MGFGSESGDSGFGAGDYGGVGSGGMGPGDSGGGSGDGGGFFDSNSVDSALSGFFGDLDAQSSTMTGGYGTSGNEVTDAMIDDALDSFFGEIDAKDKSMVDPNAYSLTAKVGGVIAGLITALATGSLSLGVVTGRLAAMGLHKLDAQALVDRVMSDDITPEEATKAATTALAGNPQMLSDITGVEGGGGDDYSGFTPSNLAQVAGTVDNLSADTTLTTSEKEQQILDDIQRSVDEGLGFIDAGTNAALDFLSPYLDTQALDRERALLEDPTLLLDDPAFQFKLDQKMGDLTNAFSRISGGGVTGNMLRASQEETQNLVSSELTSAFNRLQPFIGLSAQANEAASRIDAQGGQAKANLRMAGVTQQGGVTNQLAQSAANTALTQGQLASELAAAKSNQNINQISDVVNAVSQFSQLFV